MTRYWDIEIPPLKTFFLKTPRRNMGCFVVQCTINYCIFLQKNSLSLA
nr:MAG TPA: hypothetical protein [Caudoviricetes sp.]